MGSTVKDRMRQISKAVAGCAQEVRSIACYLLILVLSALLHSAHAEPLIWCQPFFHSRVPESQCRGVVRAQTEPIVRPALCERPYLSKNLGLCASLKRLQSVHITPDFDELYDRMAIAAQRDSASVRSYECIYRNLTNWAMSRQRTSNGVSTVPALSIAQCGAVSALRRAARVATRLQAAQFLCSEAYIMYEDITGRTLPTEFVGQAVNICAQGFS